MWACARVLEDGTDHNIKMGIITMLRKSDPSLTQSTMDVADNGDLANNAAGSKDIQVQAVSFRVLESWPW